MALLGVLLPLVLLTQGILCDREPITCPDGTPGPGIGLRKCNCYQEDGKRVINCRNRRLTEIPRMNSIEEWDLLNLGINKITEVPTGIFEGLPHLKSIDFFYNTELTTLQSNAFQGADEIQDFTFTRCRISSIGDNAFSNLYNLITLNLQSNDLTVITKNAFSGLGALEYLRLDLNKIDTIHPKAFSSLTNLTTLTLYGNQFTEVPQSSFKPLKELADLDLSNNKITTVPEDAFQGLAKLERLSLWKNEITSLSENVFKNQQMLRILQLSENKLSKLPQTLFQHTVNLMQLEIVKNQLNIIENGTFEHNFELKYIFLTDNYLTQWSLYAFTNQASLVELALGQNEIENVPAFAFETLHRVKKLTLASRKPIKFHENAFCGLDSLQELDMTGSAMFGIRVCHLKHLPTFNNGLKLLVTDSKINCGCDMWSVIRSMCVSGVCNIVGVDKNECVAPPKHRGKNWWHWSDWHYKQIGCSPEDKNPVCPVPCGGFQPTTAGPTTLESNTKEATTMTTPTTSTTTPTTKVSTPKNANTAKTTLSPKPPTEPPIGTGSFSSSSLLYTTTSITITTISDASAETTAVIISVGGVVVVIVIIAIVVAVVLVKHNKRSKQTPRGHTGSPPPYNGQNQTAPVVENFYPPDHPMHHNGPQLPDGQQNAQVYTNPEFDNENHLHDKKSAWVDSNVPKTDKVSKPEADILQNFKGQPAEDTKSDVHQNHPTDGVNNTLEKDTKKNRKSVNKNKVGVMVEPELNPVEQLEWPIKRSLPPLV